ncbi:hypothetical protein BJ166DRAFT_527118 [Pestalotiopsis sp. NC0098]|nr:hypothetical protein BJ166DRAFT_527118 [Pestalotiopsis sp. NC0098]
MSGFEVAGIVLGVLPLAIKAVNSYRTILSSSRSARDDLDWLRRDLETEVVRLQNTCEILLNEIAPPSMVDCMIKDPFGPDWAKYNDKLRERMWFSWGNFQEQVQILSKATTELEKKLCMDLNGVIKLNSAKKILSEIKQKTAFTLRKADFEKILSQIRSSNTILQGLVPQGINIMSNRRRRSQVRVIKLFRGLSRSIFNAMHNAVTCKCTNFHYIGIEMSARNAVLLPDDEEDKVAETFRYNVVLDSTDALTNWNCAKLQLENSRTVSVEKSAPALSVPAPLKEKRKGVSWPKFSETRGSQQDRTPTPLPVRSMIQDLEIPLLTATTPSRHDSPSLISNLCRLFHEKGAVLHDSGCCGFISDTNTRRFRLSLPPPEEPSRFSHAVKLHDLLSGVNAIEKRYLPQFEYEEKLQLALTLANSVLYTYNTPWLTRNITANDVTLLSETDEKQSLESVKNPFRPFFIKAVPLSDRDDSAARVATNQRMINTTVLSLGALLIQIIIGSVEDSLAIPAMMNLEEVYVRREVASELETRVIENGGTNYAKVVSWCFDKAIGLAGFQNDSFCQEFYEVVIATLEEDVELLREQTSDYHE